MSKKKISIYDQIKEDLIIFRKNRDNKSLDSLRIVLGELQRNPNKDYSDKSVLAQLKTIRKVTLKTTKPDYLIVSIVENYLPDPVTKPEIREWLKNNGYNKETISMLKNPMSLIGIIKGTFHDRDIDGNMMKSLINDIINDVDGVKEEILIESYLDVMTRKNV